MLIALGILIYITQQNISSLEKVQRRAARFLFRDYSRESSVSCILSALGWPLLSERRKCQRLNFTFKASQTPNDIGLSKYVSLSHSRIRRSHDIKFNHLPARTDFFKFSFFPRTIPIWNSLPQAIDHAASPASFSAGLASGARARLPNLNNLISWLMSL